MKGLVITTDGQVQPYDGDDYADLQAAVGGYFQVAPTPNWANVTIWCAEDVRALGYEPNPIASSLWSTLLGYGIEYDEWLVGHVVVTGGASSAGKALDLRPAMEEQIRSYIRQAKTAPRATIEQRDSGKWVVMYNGTVVGRHDAKFRAQQQADGLNA